MANQTKGSHACNKIKKLTLSSLWILILAMASMMAIAQPGLAEISYPIPQPVKTKGYISVAPKLLGVGQTATVNLWVLPVPTNYAYMSWFKGYIGITVTFTRPDGTKDTFMPVDGTGQYAPGQTEATGSLYFFYTPDMPGNWSVSFTMPQQNVTDKYGTVIYAGCTSNTFYFTVQTEPVYAGLLNGWPWAPLPKDTLYWGYPISSNNREWSQVCGEWLGHSSTGHVVNSPTCRLWQPYGLGPNTGHIVWIQPLRAGGIVGGAYGSLSYSSDGGLDNYVIMEGRVFVNIPNTGQFACFDLRTGELLYKASGSITAGLHLPGNPYIQAILDPSVVLASSFGNVVTPVLFGAVGSNWVFYDPFTGAQIRSIANAAESSIPRNNVSSNYYELDVLRWSYKLIDGTNLAYGVASGTLWRWNLSKVKGNNWPTGIEWTRVLPAPKANRTIQLLGVSADGSVLVVWSNPIQYWGYSAKDGTKLWELTLDYNALVNEAITLYGVDAFIVYNANDATFKCYSMLNGSLLWTSRSYSDSPWATTWTVYRSETHDMEKLYLALPDGTVSALSLATGKEIWRSKPFPSTEFTNNVVPYVGGGMVLVGGNIYVYAGYSLGYQINPIPRFAMLVCIDASTGEIKFTLNGAVAPIATAYGYVIGSGIYTRNIYAIGKGPSKTTVTVSPKVSALGLNVLIEGSVVDMSPAAQSYASKALFPNGVPAVADEDMSEWMDYLYMQNATLLNNPPNPKGVTVKLIAVDSKGSSYEIGTVTSDSSGLYKLTWTPETEGEYTIYAMFEGSESYWASYATTALSAYKPAEAETPATVEAPAYTVIDLAIIAVVIVVAVLVVYTLYTVRKLRK